MINRSGFNVYPAEIEQVLNSHPDVLYSAVVGRSVPGNEEVIAFVEASPGHKINKRFGEVYCRQACLIKSQQK